MPPDEEHGTAFWGSEITHGAIRVHRRYVWIDCRELTRGFDFRTDGALEPYPARAITCRNCLQIGQGSLGKELLR